MSTNRDRDKIKIPGGKDCRCGKTMQRFKHSDGWSQLPGRNYFSCWDVCQHCGRVKNYNNFKILSSSPQKQEVAVSIFKEPKKNNHRLIRKMMKSFLGERLAYKGRRQERKTDALVQDTLKKLGLHTEGDREQKIDRIYKALSDGKPVVQHSWPDVIPAAALKVKKKIYSEKKYISAPDFYRTEEWRILRYKALKLQGGACQCCGAKPTPGHPLHVDHIKPRSKYPKLALVLANLQVLCEDCNLGKLAWDETDWRPKEDEIVNLVFTVVREG